MSWRMIPNLQAFFPHPVIQIPEVSYESIHRIQNLKSIEMDSLRGCSINIGIPSLNRFENCYPWIQIHG
jgi:hypothetical protein